MTHQISNWYFFICEKRA